MSRLAKVALGIVAVLVLIQLVSFERTNPPVAGELAAPAEVQPLLKRACYDCHSNETTWPWYSKVAPVSWLVHRDVVEGRKHLNFSTWASVSAERKAKKFDDLVEEVVGGDMPPWFYLPLHPEAKLTPDEQQTLLRWARHAAGPESP
jgi:cytochrome c551/c552